MLQIILNRKYKFCRRKYFVFNVETNTIHAKTSLNPYIYRHIVAYQFDEKWLYSTLT